MFNNKPSSAPVKDFHFLLKLMEAEKRYATEPDVQASIRVSIELWDDLSHKSHKTWYTIVSEHARDLSEFSEAKAFGCVVSLELYKEHYFPEKTGFKFAS